MPTNISKMLNLDLSNNVKTEGKDALSKQEMLLDAYISNKIEQFGGRRFKFNKYHIEPSPDFTIRTMGRIIKLERTMRKKRIMTDAMFVATALLPFVAQKVWLNLRYDAFDISPLPFGQIIRVIYNMFLSPVTAIVLLSVGALCALAYLANQYKWKFLSSLSVMDFSRFISIKGFSR